ncbi:MAG: ABC transporter substrate-binding protein [Coxiellaceae bacterium]|jgi:putative hydroxymethylpyrimidine transport system substrate-binding protein|nr:ABC transporter substrate-binding protein [Coxiellaceae bacterium]
MSKFFKLIFLFFILPLTVDVSGEQENLVVVLDWFINSNHAPLLVAEQEGFFARHGLQVRFVTPADPLEGEKMVAVGKADVALTYEPTLLLHVKRGIPLAQFATLIDRPLNCLVVLNNGKIQSLKDLKGKRLGYGGTEIERIIFAVMLKTVGLSLDDVQMINVKFNLVSALLTNKIDGFIGGMRNFEPEILKLHGKSVRVFYPEKSGFPKYSELIFVAHKNKIHNPSLAKFTSALKEGVEYLKKNPERSWQKFIMRHPELNHTLNHQVWFLSLQYFSDHPERFSQLQSQKLMQVILDNY